MATWTLRRFSQTNVLSSVRPDRLRQFLTPYAEFLARRNVALPAVDSPVDVEALRQVFLSPDRNTPADLVDALFVVDAFLTPSATDTLTTEAAARGLLLDDTDATPADVALQVWMRDRELMERLHAEQQMSRVRSFVHFQIDRTSRRATRRPTERRLEDMARRLDDGFELRKRGRGVRVLMGSLEESWWFLVRRGDPLHREESLNGNEASSVCYRPIRHDVAVYVPQIGELRIHAKTKADQELYRSAFGELLFGNAEAFPGAEKYTLEPLRDLGEDALACGDVEGIEWIRLEEVQWYHAGVPWEVVTRKSEDLFRLFDSQGKPFPESGRIVKARFRVKFADAKSARAVTIRPSNVALYARDDDAALVERWLALRGFVIDAGATVHEESSATVPSD